jgi:hypothetical protein
VDAIPALELLIWCRMAEWSLMLGLVVETMDYLHTMDLREPSAAPTWSAQISSVKLQFVKVIKCLLNDGNRYCMYLSKYIWGWGGIGRVCVSVWGRGWTLWCLVGVGVEGM